MATNVRGPVDAKVIEQVPVPAVSALVQDSPVFAATETEPEGEVMPLTLKLMTTGWEMLDGFGVVELIVVALFAFAAATVLTDCTGAYEPLPACEAVSVQVPVPLVMVTVALLIIQTPEAASVTGRPELAVAETVNVLSYAADAGVVANVMVCVSRLLTVSVVELSEAAE